MSAKTLENPVFVNSDDLEAVIQSAMGKVRALKETDLCFFISYESRRLHHAKYIWLKEKDPQKLRDLIEESILNREPIKLPTEPRSEEGIRKNLNAAMQLSLEKVNAKEDWKLCRYFPNPKTGYMHPLAFRKLQKENPKELIRLLKEFILDPENPKLLKGRRAKTEELEEAPLPKKIDHLVELMTRFLKNAEKSIDQQRQKKEAKTDSKIQPAEKDQDPLRSRYLKTVQNQLIKQIREKKADLELWETYLELIQ